jgi:hypothetical protein
MPYQAKGVPARFVSVGPATAAKASSGGWRLCLRPNIGTWQRYTLSDVEPISAMMDPPSSFIFENIPFHLKHHLLLNQNIFVF